MQEMHHFKFWAARGWFKVAQFRSLKSRFLRTNSLETEFSNLNVLLPHSKLIVMRTSKKMYPNKKIAPGAFTPMAYNLLYL